MKKYTYLTMLVVCACLVLSGCGKAGKLYEQGVAMAEQGDYKQAAEYMQKAIHKNAERAEYYISYGMILNRQGEYEKAIEQFERAYQDTKNSIANANNKQIYFGEAISYYHLSELDKSLELCEKALSFKEPESMDGDILCSKGAVLETLGNTEEALAVYSEAIKKDSQNWDAYLKRASLEAQSDQVQAAKEDYQKVIQGDGRQRFEACFKLYELCEENGEEETATQALQQVISSKSKDSFVICQIGWAYHCQGDEKKAKEYLEKSQKAGYQEAGYYLGMLAMEQKDYAQAQKYFEKYLSSGAVSFSGMAYNQLAGCAMEQGDWEKAQNYLEEGRKTADGSSRACLWKNQIILLEKQGDFKQAKKEAKEYLSVYPMDKGMKKEYRFIKTRKQNKQKETVAASQGAVGME